MLYYPGHILINDFESKGFLSIFARFDVDAILKG